MSSGGYVHPPDWVRLDQLATWFPDDSLRYEVVEELRRVREPAQFRIYLPEARPTPIRDWDALDPDWNHGTAKILVRQMLRQGFTCLDIVKQLGLMGPNPESLRDVDELPIILEATWDTIKSAYARVQHRRRLAARGAAPLIISPTSSDVPDLNVNVANNSFAGEALPTPSDPSATTASANKPPVPEADLLKWMDQRVKARLTGALADVPWPSEPKELEMAMAMFPNHTVSRAALRQARANAKVPEGWRPAGRRKPAD